MNSFLDANVINLKAPYKVTQIDDLSVQFCTGQGIDYVVGFTIDPFIFEDNSYFFYIGTNSNTGGYDPKIFPTIMAVIENLFDNSKTSIVIYVCSPSDQRQAARSRLFGGWFEQSEAHEEYTLEIRVTHSDGQDNYYGMIVRKDHPDYSECIRSFNEFLDDY